MTSPSLVTARPSPKPLKATSMTMPCWTLGQLTRVKICKTRSTISPLNKMRFLHNSSVTCYFRFSFITSLLALFLLFSGCTVNQIYYQTPPSAKALTDINYIYIDQFKGEQSVLFSKILTHVINQQPLLKSLVVFPEKEDPNAAILSVEVQRYAVHDTEEITQQTHISLVEHKVLQDNPEGLNTIKRVFEFVEKSYPERLIKRTLDLEISFKIISAAGDEILYLNPENASLKQSYRGEENILLIPDALDEMARLAQLLMQKFLDRINPEPQERVVALEKGSSPVPWTFGMLDFGHPRIVRSNHFASGMRYDLALKGWNYVLFEPRTYPESTRFFFTNQVFLRLKRAGLPHTTLQPLLEVHEKSFDQDEINIILLGLIPNQDFKRYAQIIKSHARVTQNIDRLNLATSHYNLGVVYQLRSELGLAEYHFSQANAYNPHAKYSQAWTDLQHLRGDYNPLDELMDPSVESAGKLNPPDGALLQPKN